MRVLIDTNVLLRGVEPTHTNHSSARASVIALLQRGDEVVVVPQVLYEFWVAATRPLQQNGLGHDARTAAAAIDDTLASTRLLEDPVGIFAEWRKLVLKHIVHGKPAHDARLVAAMRLHAIPSILTFNVSDFTRYENISVLAPAEIALSR